MQEHRLELADVFRAHGEEYLRHLGAQKSFAQRKVLQAVVACRTRALGGHISVCSQCGHREQSYNSCRNRHCPKCLGAKTAAWMEKRAQDLLPIPYFHVVFTLPHELNNLILHNKKLCYDILFKAASETLLEVGKNPKHLGANIGSFGIIHTWNQTLQFHPHVHFVVTGGGLTAQGEWKSCKRKSFFAPVKVLQKLFRGKFIAYLKCAYRKKQLWLEGNLEPLRADQNFEALLDRSCKTPWVVYCKPPFAGPEAVLKYLSTYTHRIAISNKRLQKLEQGNVSFSYRDSADHSKRKTLSLPAVEFIRRFMLHLVPFNFYRIRHFGFLANSKRRKNLEIVRLLLQQVSSLLIKSLSEEKPPQTALLPCPCCKIGIMEHSIELPPLCPDPQHLFGYLDSS